MTNQDSRIRDTFKINDNAYRFFNSGLHKMPFFTEIHNVIDDIKRNNKLHLIEFYYEEFEKYYGKQFCETEKKELAIRCYQKVVSEVETCFHPLTYVEDTAHRCNLLPFRYKGLGLLGLLPNYKPILYARLDSYQALTNGTIDPNSKLFTHKEFFIRHVGVDLTNEVLRRISKY